jgi:hypothetical protein
MHSYSYSAPDESISTFLDMNITVLFTANRHPIVTITFDVCHDKCLTFRYCSAFTPLPYYRSFSSFVITKSIIIPSSLNQRNQLGLKQ